MEITLNDIISIVGLLAGGGGIGWWFTWKYGRRREAASAKQAEAEAMGAEVNTAKEVQDVYQQMVADVKAERQEQKEYIQELKEDRRHLREDRNELRRRQEELEDKVMTLNRNVARYGRQVEAMRPFLCADLMCKTRQHVIMADEKGDVKDGNADQ